jgi:hypothetical protein
MDKAKLKNKAYNVIILFAGLIFILIKNWWIFAIALLIWYNYDTIIQLLYEKNKDYYFGIVNI